MPIGEPAAHEVLRGPDTTWLKQSRTGLLCWPQRRSSTVAAATSRPDVVMYVTCDGPQRVAATRTCSSSPPRANGAGDSVAWGRQKWWRLATRVLNSQPSSEPESLSCNIVCRTRIGGFGVTTRHLALRPC